MPMFVWIAIVVAILLVGGSTAITVANPSTATAALTPVGYGIAVAIVASALLWKIRR